MPGHTSTFFGGVMHVLSLRFFDLAVTIQSDQPDFMQLFSYMFDRFRVSEAASATDAQRLTAVYTATSAATPTLTINDTFSAALPPQIAFQTILNTVAAGVRSHILLHAGALAHNGSGIMIAADSRHGKTTLVLALLRAGFHFLSDHIAAVGRADGRLHPFPRRLGVRRGALELAGFTNVTPDGYPWQDRVLMDVTALQPDALTTAVPLRHVILLKNPAADADPTDARPLWLLVNRSTPDFLDAVHDHEDVLQMRVQPHHDYPLLHLTCRRRAPVLAHVHALCAQHTITLLDVIKRAEPQPSFDGPARLRPIATSAAVMELLKQFKGGHQSRLLQDEFDGSATRLYVELARLLGDADCYVLEVGPLPQMVRLVRDAVSSQPTAVAPQRKRQEQQPA